MQEPSATRVADLATLADAQLVQLARQKDGAAFRTIMQRHNRRLYRMARAVVLNDSEAEDVVQEAYVRAFTYLNRFRGDSSLATWLSRIVLNEALGRLRRSRPTVDLETIDNRPPSQASIPICNTTARSRTHHGSTRNSASGGTGNRRSAGGVPDRSDGSHHRGNERRGNRSGFAPKRSRPGCTGHGRCWSRAARPAD